MDKRFAWFLGFLLSDGSIVRPTYRKKGDESHISFCIHVEDAEVLEKIKDITNASGNVRLYPKYKSPQAQLSIYDRELVATYINIKNNVPNVTNYERHFIRGLIDGDGCLNYRQNRNSFRINYLNQYKSIVEWVCKTLSEKLLIPYKNPRWKKEDNLWIVEWEGKIARLIAWYLYHGNVTDCVLDRKYEYYKAIIDPNDNILEAIGLRKDGQYIHMNVPYSKSLEWCHRIQNILSYNTVPVPLNKGKRKYYSLYVPVVNTQGITDSDEGIVH